MNLKKIVFLFTLTMLSSIAVVGCDKSQEDFKEKNQDQMNSHGHSH